MSSTAERSTIEGSMVRRSCTRCGSRSGCERTFLGVGIGWMSAPLGVRIGCMDVSPRKRSRMRTPSCVYERSAVRYDVGMYGEIRGDLGRSGEIWGDLRRYGEIWGDIIAPVTPRSYMEEYVSSRVLVGIRECGIPLLGMRYGEIWGDMGRYGEIWGDMGRDKNPYSASRGWCADSLKYSSGWSFANWRT